MAVQVANPSPEIIALHVGLEIGKLSSVAKVSPAQLNVHAVAATPKTPTEIAAARAEIAAPLSKAFFDSTFTVEHQSAILDLCAKYRPVLLLSKAELGKCTTAEATLPPPVNTEPVSRRHIAPIHAPKLLSTSVYKTCLLMTSLKSARVRGPLR